MRQQAQREKERVEEGLRLSRERAAEKARAEAAALEKANREKKELEDKKEVQYTIYDIITLSHVNVNGGNVPFDRNRRSIYSAVAVRP